MKLLIAGSPSKIFHLKEFGEELKKFDVDYKLVIDINVYTGFPSRKIRNWFQNKSKFNKLITKFSPDAVFIDRQTNFGLASIEANLPLFVHLRGDYWSETKWARETLYKYPPKRQIIWFKERIADKCFKGATSILPITKYLENEVKKNYPDKDTHVLYQGISSSNWYPATGMNLKHPCVGLLQDANIWGKTREMYTLTKVMKALPNVMFYWVGDGPYRNKILPVLQKFKNFKWLGYLQYPEKIREYLTEVDVYALVSGADQAPLTMQEAALMEKPVVATNIAGIPEMLSNEESGFLIEKGDHEEWVKKLSLLLNDKNKSKQMGKSGRNFIKEKFSWEVVVKDFVNMLKMHIK